MSRTYRKIPHWASKKSLHRDFDERCGHWGFHRRLNDFTNADDYVRAATAHFRGERASGWRGMKSGVAPNGNVIGYEDDASRCPAARTRTNKRRRELGKKEIALAVAEMADNEQAAIAELIAMDRDLFGDIDEGHWADWDDYSEYDSDPLPEDDYCEDDYNDPFEDEYRYDPFWEMGYDMY